MNDRLCSFTRILTIVSGLVLASCGAKYPGIPAPGSSAPDFTLLNQDGKPIRLKDYRGRWVVLYFYSGDFARQVTEDMHSFKADLEKLQQLNTVVLGISGDDVSSHKSFAERQQLPFALLSDQGRIVSKQYGSFKKKFLFHKLVVYSTFVINPEGSIARVLYDFGPADPGGEIISTLNTLQRSSSSRVTTHPTGSGAREAQRTT